MTHQLIAAERTHTGLLRSTNQDAVYAGQRLLVIADGMGGHAAGDLASRVVVSAFRAIDTETAAQDLTGTLLAAMTEGNKAIADLVADDPELSGMGTTATAMLFAGDQVALVHIGDSRAYLYRNGILQQLSSDDTFVQSLIDEGRITADEAAHHPQRNLLLRALNGSDPRPQVFVREVSAGDRYLLCSDGLSGIVPAESVADALAITDPNAAADKLIELALAGGGPDNVSVIVADVVDTGAAERPKLAADPDATGEFQAAHPTRSMPRIALPPIPEIPGAKPVFLTAEPLAVELADDDDGLDTPESPDDDDLRSTAAEIEQQLPLLNPTARRHRRIAMVIGGLTLLVLALAGAGVWIASQYYVSDDHGRVVIYRGVTGVVFGIPLSSVVEDSCGPDAPDGCVPLRLENLQPAAQDQVASGISARNLDGARDVIARLSMQTTQANATFTLAPSSGTDSTDKPGSGRGGTPGNEPSGHGQATSRPTETSTATPGTQPKPVPVPRQNVNSRLPNTVPDGNR